MIRAEGPDGSTEERTPVRWIKELETPEAVVRQAFVAGSAVRVARVECRWVVDSESVHGEEGYLNRIEIWGDPQPGRLELFGDRVVYTPDAADSMEWPLETFTAVQASSSSLQLNRRDAVLVSFRFQNDSIFLWEQLLHETLRTFYQRTGRGEILEFQPRIVAS